MSFPENEWSKCFGLLVKNFQRVWNCVLLVHRNVLRKNLFSFESMNAYHFQTMRKILAFSCRNRKTCIRPEKLGENILCFRPPLDILEEKLISHLIISRQFRNMKKTFGLLPKFFWQLRQNCILRVQRNIMWISFFSFFDEINFSQIFSILERANKFSTFWPKFLVVFKNCILPVQINFCKTTFFEKNLWNIICLGHWKKNRPIVVFFYCFVNFAFYVTLGTVLEKLLFL